LIFRPGQWWWNNRRRICDLASRRARWCFYGFW